MGSIRHNFSACETSFKTLLVSFILITMSTREERQSAEEKGLKLFVHGVGEETSNEDLKFVFEKHGQVTDTFNPGRGFAFVTFSSPGEAQDAIDALNESEILGRKVSINVARPKEGGGGGYRGGRGRGGFRGGRGRY